MPRREIRYASPKTNKVMVMAMRVYCGDKNSSDDYFDVVLLDAVVDSKIVP